ncbi:T9SS type A sorting domain-containing protein [Hymenobacter sp.]|uniref:T9SS type A sorting domain-containing protein n=1 Tax=Hymenobacter sp. TaxID=1898978 RepID=UPI00286A8F65|nr:T9SS type A sorting domain-containing protein [Hymenobacter sp.]
MQNLFPVFFAFLTRGVALLMMLVFPLLPLVGWGQVSITTSGTPLTENFNTLAIAGTSSTVPTGFAFSEAGSNADPNYAAGTGSANAGDTYSFGAAPATERAFGVLRSGALIPIIGAAYANNTGQTIVSLAISYTGEQWRLGATGRSDRLDFQYSTNATSLTDGTWTDVNALDFTGPVTAGTVGSLDGNVASNRTAVTSSVTGLSIPAGTTFRIRWLDFDPAGADDGLAVDDFSLTATSVAPMPVTYYAKPTGNLELFSTFGTNVDGTGTAPTSFTANTQTFIVGGAGRTIGADWTVSGTGSKVVIDANASFTVPAAFNFTGPLDLGSGATLVQQNAAPAVTYGTVAATSTIEFSQSGIYTLAAGDIPGTGFGNLALRNATKNLPGTTIAIAGNLVVDNVSGFSGGTIVPNFTTVNLGGNLSLTGTTTFEATGNGRITVVATNTTTPQLISGRGNAVRLFRLTLPTGQAGVSLDDANGGTPLEVGNAAGGGYSLATGTTLNINNNTLSFFSGGKAAITGTTGQLAFGAGASLLLNRNSTTPLGTLTLTPASTQLANLTLDVQGTGNTLTLPNDLTVTGTLSLQNGILASATGNLTVTGPLLTAATGLLAVNPTTNLVVGGSGTAGNIYLSPATGAEIGSLTLNRAGITLRLNNSLKVTNALTLTTGTLNIGPGNTLEIAGNLTTAGLASPLQGLSNSNLIFSGSGTVTGLLNLIPQSGALNTLTLNRTTFALIPLVGSISVGTLSLAKGALQTSGTDRIIAGILDPANPGNVDSFVNALTLTTPAATTAAITYPLAVRQGVYRPLTLNIDAQGTAAATAYTARITEQNTNSRGYVGALTRVSAVRYYTVREESTANFQQGRITLSYGPEDFVNNTATLRVATSAGTGTPYADVDDASTPVFTAGTITANLLTPAAVADLVLATTTLVPNENPLPVELTRFTAARQASGVALTWTTASEVNSAYFEVQRSANGREFGVVAKAEARGTNSAPTAYSAVDAQAPAGRLYYRLRQVDLDGTAAYSPVATVEGAEALAKAAPYPNPARTSIYFPAAAATAYRVLNQLGQPLLRGIAEAGTATVPVGALAPGLYFLEMQTPTGRVVQKFEKE